MSPTPAVSVIIPTKDRTADLELTVQTLLRQSLLPSELLIVDQSDSEESRTRIEALLCNWPDDRCRTVRLHYLYDPSIPGGAIARNLAMDRATGDILLFLDDDVELEQNFVEEIIGTYMMHPGVTGVSGVVTNYAPPPLYMWMWMRTFERGPFHDDRQGLYWKASKLRDRGLYRVTRMGAGLMSFRARNIGKLRFDANLRGVSDGEDVDFCMHLAPGAELVINPRARLVHHQSAFGRAADHWLHRYLRAQIYLYFRNWDRGVKNRLCLAWLLTGSALTATQASLRSASLKPWKALLNGYKEGALAAGR